MYDALAATLNEIDAASSEAAVWNAYAAFMESAGVPVYLVLKGGNDALPTVEKLLSTNAPIIAIERIDAAASDVRPIRRLALRATRSFLVSEHRDRLMASQASRRWIETFEAVTGGMDMLVIPVRREGVHIGIGQMCGAPALFDDASIAAFTAATNAAFNRRTRLLLEAGEAKAPRPTLTPRQRRILDCIAEGMSEADIAERLGISRRTVRFHVDDARNRLGVMTRRLAVDRARRLGLLGRGELSS
jgi:DNA-binding CsgD family transcriptional regulator